VYALGQIGFDFISEARLDSLVQRLAGQAGLTTSERVLAFDARRLLTHLEHHPSDAAALEWTLTLDGTPIYAIRPQGPFAAEVYEHLRSFLRERLDEGVERVSIPGTISGRATLLMGQVVPVIVPELRGMYSWTTLALVDAIAGAAPGPDAPSEHRELHALHRNGIRNFLERVYHEMRNLGVQPQERALNFAATNAFNAARVFEDAIRDRMELESVNVVRSAVSRPGSDCWDVEVYLFYPERQVQNVRRVHRFTVDVSDLVPVTVGPTRSWFTR
jgi:cyanobactin maturation PatA/PatG family protease